MASSEDLRRYRQDGSSVLALIDDYRAQQEAWRAKAHDLARMRDALRAAADREARAIVAAAQRDIDQVLQKANEDLVALNAQVRALSETADTSLPAEQAGVKFGRRAGDLQQVAAMVKGAQEKLADVSDATRTRLEALSAEAAAGAGPPLMMVVDRADATVLATPALPEVDSVDAFDAFPSDAGAVVPASCRPDHSADP
jgi:hypothetical protein